MLHVSLWNWNNTIIIYILHLADTFIQSDLQMRTIEDNKDQQKSINTQVL